MVDNETQVVDSAPEKFTLRQFDYHASISKYGEDLSHVIDMGLIAF